MVETPTKGDDDDDEDDDDTTTLAEAGGDEEAEAPALVTDVDEEVGKNTMASSLRRA